MYCDYSIHDDIKNMARQILWVDKNFILVLACSPENSLASDCLYAFHVTDEKMATEIWHIHMNMKIIRMIADDITRLVILEDDTGNLFEGKYWA
jgi:hypothetical protein